MSFEATWLEIMHVGQAKDGKGLKIVQLSDIHIARLKVPYKKIKQAIDAEKPDIIVMTGDYIEMRRHAPRFFKFLDYIKGNHRIFLCLGNHDYEAFENNGTGLSHYIGEFEKHGVTMLHNQCACIEKNQKKYNLIGIADIRYKLHDIEKALNSCQTDAFMNIAFSSLLPKQPLTIASISGFPSATSLKLQSARSENSSSWT
jgi:predicted MPP superfamily phosphohydrolase